MQKSPFLGWKFIIFAVLIASENETYRSKITHNSQATALRDIQDLVEKGLLTKTDSGGRGSSYELAE